jgi:hypothetical protein
MKLNRWIVGILICGFGLAAFVGLLLVDGESSGGASTARPKLSLLNYRESVSAGGRYKVIDGQVQNVSGEPIQSLAVVVTWYTADNKLMTTDSALVEFNPLMPDQKSPFKSMTRANPEMKSYTVEFKSLRGGGRIPHVDQVTMR